MIVKTLRRCFLNFFLGFLAACGRQTVTLPTETPIPIIVSATPIPTSTVISITLTPSPLPITPSPLPTESIIPFLTPDAIQVERWNEYEEALAKSFFRSYFQPEEAVCEWVILGQANQEVYVYAYCTGTYSAGPSSASIPAVIHLGTDGSVESAEIPGGGSSYGPDIRRMFPSDIQETIFSHMAIFSQEHEDRLRWRRAHPDQPPLIVLPFLPAQPTQPTIPWIMPKLVQVERWREYQTALARQLSYLYQDESVCEWELLGRSGNEIYVWAICGVIRGNRVGMEDLVVIYVIDDGSVVGALASANLRQFPLAVQEKYFSGTIHFQELVDHLRWRQSQGRWEEPPLIILNATPSP